jgi:hypothetical protein
MPILRDKRRGRAIAESVGKKTMSVSLLAFQRHKEPSRSGAA